MIKQLKLYVQTVNKASRSRYYQQSLVFIVVTLTNWGRKALESYTRRTLTTWNKVE